MCVSLGDINQTISFLGDKPFDGMFSKELFCLNSIDESYLHVSKCLNLFHLLACRRYALERYHVIEHYVDVVFHNYSLKINVYEKCGYVCI